MKTSRSHIDLQLTMNEIFVRERIKLKIQSYSDPYTWAATAIATATKTTAKQKGKRGCRSMKSDETELLAAARLESTTISITVWHSTCNMMNQVYVTTD